MKALLKMMLAPVHEALAELQESAEDNRRQGNNLINKGVVVSSDGKRVVVNVGENRTPPIQFMVPAAGLTSTYRCPSAGEIALVLNYGTGDNFQSSVALCGLFSDAFPFPTDNPDEVVTAYGENAYQKVDVTSGKMTFHAAGGVEFVDTPEVINRDGEIADQVRSMSGDREIYDGHDHQGDSGGKTGSANQKQGG